MRQKHSTPMPPNPSGLCQCGCGESAPIAKLTNARIGHLRGEPVRYVPGHSSRVTALNKRIEGLPAPNPTGLCGCGCGQTTRIATQTHINRGDVRGEHVKYIKGHWAKLSLREQSWIVDPQSGCWVWQKYKDEKGYGRVFGGGAHRRVYRLHKGPIPPGLQLDHLCFNPSCVNPDHLEPVTNAENQRRAKLARKAATAKA